MYLNLFVYHVCRFFALLINHCLLGFFFQRLFWPKSRCFDYLYQDAEKLLRSYPVQAAICLYEDSSSDEGSDDEEEEVGEEEGEEMEKDLN